MKKSKLIFTLCGVTAVAAVVAVGAVYMNSHKLRNVSYTLPDGFTVTAHTGCEGEKDNTLESIKAGAEAGAEIVEIDLSFKSDGTAVLSHDDPDTRPISEEMPSLDSAFLLLSTLEVKMNVDVKSTLNLSAVSELAEKYGVEDKIFFTGVRQEYVEAVKSDAKGIAYYLNVSVDKERNTDPAYLAEIIGQVKDSGAIGINMSFKECSKELVTAFRNEGLLVSVWTAKSENDMYRCLSFEPDNITTRKPSALKKIIEG